MDWDTQATLHRRRPGQSEDRLTTSGPIGDLVRQVRSQPDMTKDQYFIMVGGMRYDRHDIEGLAREFDPVPPPDA
jgi:hypothetical protein